MTTVGTELTGRMLIAGDPVPGGGEQIRAVDPGTGAQLDPAYGWGGPAEVQRACAAAEAAFD
ncbi:MAG: benzaldehyde dehydrogenase, partial [Saccharopolyspora sp.]|nr:benzaldehyde dehydrogenase [Saccharopolyspora sp.]